jgi:hypothetical protein
MEASNQRHFLIALSPWIRGNVSPRNGLDAVEKNLLPLHYFNYYYYSWWGATESAWYCGHDWPIVPTPDDRWWWLWSNWWNDDRQGKPKYSEKTYPTAILSTTNPTWPDAGSNPGRRGGSPTTNLLSYDTCELTIPIDRAVPDPSNKGR